MGVRRSWLITPLALGLVTTFPQLFICKTWRCFGFSFVDWCALCTCLNLDLQKLRSWMLSLHSWRFNEILEKRLFGLAIKTWLNMWLIHSHFAEVWTDVFAVHIPWVDKPRQTSFSILHVEIDVWRMELSGSLWKVWESLFGMVTACGAERRFLMHRWMMYLSRILFIPLSSCSAETATQPLSWFNHHCNS